MKQTNYKGLNMAFLISEVFFRTYNFNLESDDKPIGKLTSQADFIVEKYPALVQVNIRRSFQV